QTASYAPSLAAGQTVGAIARTARADAPLVEPARPIDLLLDAVCDFYADGAAAATSSVRAANEALLSAPPSPETVRGPILGARLAFETFDDELVVPLAERAVHVVRQTGMVSLFVMAGRTLVAAKVLTGDFVGGEALLQDVIAAVEDMGASASEFATVALHA